MLTRFLLGGSLVALLAGLGCKPAPTTTTPPAPSVAAPTPPQAATPPPTTPPAAVAAKEPESDPIFHLQRAQTNLPKARLIVGPRQLTAEVCTTVTQVATGLMHRESIGPDDAMFFVFGTRQQRSFYMKNVRFPIAVAYIDAEGVVDQIVQLKAMDPTPVPSKSANIQYVLETAPDWFERNGITQGALVTTVQGPLDATLARFAQLQ